jgi:hypothetical protein
LDILQQNGGNIMSIDLFLDLFLNFRFEIGSRLYGMDSYTLMKWLKVKLFIQKRFLIIINNIMILEKIM